MRITVLIENEPVEGFFTEHGLSFFIEYRGKNILLDAGSSGKFLENARLLGINMEKADVAVLSHAHYDHGDGFPPFLEINKQAVLYINKNAQENCYGGVDRHYIGLKRGFLEKHADRICFAEGICRISDGIYLIPHSTPGLEKIGEENRLYRLENGVMQGDDFNHEQSLVFRTKRGLVVFNSCSHGGAAQILCEVTAVLPGEKIYAYFGGLHLSKCTESFTDICLENLKACPPERIYTGHCTGEEAFEKISLAGHWKAERLGTGKVITI